MNEIDIEKRFKKIEREITRLEQIHQYSSDSEFEVEYFRDEEVVHSYEITIYDKIENGIAINKRESFVVKQGQALDSIESMLNRLTISYTKEKL